MTTTTAHPFTVWAPAADRVDLLLGSPSSSTLEMTRGPGGWWSAEVADAGDGTRYAFAVDGGDPTPDPRSRRQPDGVHAPSATYDHDRFAWTDGDWRGIPPEAAVAYELHIGTFTGEGTFQAAIGHLDHLAELGVTLVELLPVAAFDGTAGWGYDGVGLYAVHEPYGGPDGLKRFVDAAHARGLGVCLDAVYNHLGPSGNYLARFGPYFTDAHHTPWGAAVNLDAAGSDEVRDFLTGSAMGWLRDFHLDVLRLDAVHALVDDRALPWLEELAAAVDEFGARSGRQVWLVAESDTNDPATTAERVSGTGSGGLGLRAQWDDDIHHSLHALLTGESTGYYADFAVDPFGALAKVATRAFFHDGTYSSFRGRVHGRPVAPEVVSGLRFFGFLQNHDQIGNRAVGDRMSTRLPTGTLAAGAALLLTGPWVPMLFMGEEWGAQTPWQYFTSFADPDLGRAVSQGRRGEFAAHGWSVADVPDPQSPQTFADSRLDWSERDRDEHRQLLSFYRGLIARRRAEPELHDGDLNAVRVAFDPGRRWLAMRRGSLVTVAVLAPDGARIGLAELPDGGDRGAHVAVLDSFGGPELADGALGISGPGAALLRVR